MKATGIVRRIDDLGRIVIPKEIRRTLRIKEGDPLEIFTDREGEVILKKYSQVGELGKFAAEFAESLAKRAGHLDFCQRPNVLPGGGRYAGVFAGKTAGDAKAVLHPAHRGHCADARHERSVCVPAAGGLAEYCKLCYHYRIGAGLDFAADREKNKARGLRPAPARQAADGSCHLRLFPCGQDRYGFSFDGDAGRR